MFTAADLLGLEYFTVLKYDSSTNLFEIQSNNTKHYWQLIPRKGGYDLMHKHEEPSPYHYQTSFGTLFDAVLDIVDHDEYQMRNRKPVKYKWQLNGSYFDILIKKYDYAPFRLCEAVFFYAPKPYFFIRMSK